MPDLLGPAVRIDVSPVGWFLLLAFTSAWLSCLTWLCWAIVRRLVGGSVRGGWPNVGLVAAPHLAPLDGLPELDARMAVLGAAGAAPATTRSRSVPRALPTAAAARPRGSSRWTTCWTYLAELRSTFADSARRQPTRGRRSAHGPIGSGSR